MPIHAHSQRYQGGNQMNMRCVAVGEKNAQSAREKALADAKTAQSAIINFCNQQPDDPTTPQQPDSTPPHNK